MFNFFISSHLCQIVLILSMSVARQFMTAGQLFYLSTVILRIKL